MNAMKVIVSAAVCAAVAANGAPLIVPKTSDATLVSNPLKTGEVAYRACGDRAVSMLVGDGGVEKPVVDPMAVRGYRVGMVSRSDIALSWDNEIAYDDDLDKWTLCGHWSGSSWVNTLNATNRIVITCLSHVRISDVVFDSVNQAPRIGSPACGSITTEINGNVAIIYTVKNDAGTFELSDLAVYATIEGDKDIVNDLTTTIVPTVDSMGTSELGKWREWAYDCRAGELAYNWSLFPSKASVQMNGGNGFSFNYNKIERDRYQIRQNAHTNFVIVAGDTNAVEISYRGFATNTIRFLSVCYSNTTDTAYFDWNVVADPSAFNVANLSVQYKQYVTNATWTTAANAVKTRTTIRVPNVSSLVADVSQCYWRLLYNGAVTRSLKTTINGDLQINGALFLKGEDGQIWRIRVLAGGTIDAVAVN